ncbi:MAG TPA: HD domain-containing protein, partial [Polyangia bacterium]
MEIIDLICETAQNNHPSADIERIRRAHAFAKERHAGQLRRSGEPYLVHPLGVAQIISELKLDAASICAGLLHDCVEDTSATSEDIGRLFGPEIQRLVDGVTKLGQIAWNTREERQAENFRKMLLAMARDIRVILVKLADRVDNMRTLQHVPREKQERIARETRQIYAPIANRLGIQWMKVELEDLAFRYLEPDDYQDLAAKMAGTQASRDTYIADVCQELQRVLAAAGIPAQLSGRAKSFWSINQKMKKTGRELEQVYDIIAFRIITDSVQNCYAALGIVHSNWTPVPGRFKDYVALPKPNLYQSIHTTVIGPGSDRMEVQIRTTDMHRTAEEGIAAHWQYKEPTVKGTRDSQ